MGGGLAVPDWAQEGDSLSGSTRSCGYLPGRLRPIRAFLWKKGAVVRVLIQALQSLSRNAHAAPFGIRTDTENYPGPSGYPSEEGNYRNHNLDSRIRGNDDLDGCDWLRDGTEREVLAR